MLSELSAQSPHYTLTGRHHLSSDARCGSEAGSGSEPVCLKIFVGVIVVLLLVLFFEFVCRLVLVKATSFHCLIPLKP